MTRTVNCVKLGQELEGLSFTPYPGEIGQKIYDNVSLQAWNEWLKRQTMLINEYRLSMMDEKAQEFLATEAEKYFFGGGDCAVPEGYVPEEK